MTRVAVLGIPGKWSSETLTDAVEARTGSRFLVDPKTMVLDLETGRVMAGQLDLTSMDAVVVKKLGRVYAPHMMQRLELLRYLEQRGVRVFSSPDAIRKAVDRLTCTTTLQLGGVPIPATVVTEDIDAAVDAVERFGQAVFKPLYTSKARGMEVLSSDASPRDALVRIQGEGYRPFYLQRKMEIPGHDLGVVFLGGEYLTCYARVGSKTSWNTTTHSGGHYEPRDPSGEIIEIARTAQGLFGLDFTCVDVMETPEGPMVLEVSAFGGFRGLKEARDIDAATLYTEMILERLHA